MKLWEAIKSLEEGKKIRKVDWDSDFYVYKYKEGVYYQSDGLNFDVIYLCNTTEWEIYKEKKEVMDEKFKKLYHLIKDEEAYLNRQYEDFITEHKLEDHLTAFYRQLLEMNKYYKLDK